MRWLRRAEAAPPSGPTSLSLAALLDFLRHERARTRARLRSSELGQRRAVGSGDGLEFERLRPFEPGDDVRRIDWRASTLARSLQTRVFEAQKRSQVTIVLDRSASMGRPVALPAEGRPTSFWLGSQITLALTWLAVARHDPVSLLLPATAEAAARRIGPFRSESALQSLGRLLRETEPAGQHDLSAYAELLHRHRLGRRGTLVLIGDFLDLARPELGVTLRRLSAGGGTTIAIALDGHRCELADLRARGSAGFLVDCEDPDSECTVTLDAVTEQALDSAADDLFRVLHRTVDGPLNRVFRLDISELRTPTDLLLWLRRTLRVAGFL